ncbi:MAG: HK97 family phage prohead protease [Thermofilaceae archaeon]
MGADKPSQHLIIQDESKRIVAGWASVEVKDLQGDVVPVSVLERAMYDFMSRGGIVMYGHQNIPIGRIVRWEVRTHPDTGKPGLWIEAELYRESQVADIVWDMIKQSRLLGFSISGVGREEKNAMLELDGRVEQADVITELELTEISIVENPANPYARIEYVNYLAKGDSNDCLTYAVSRGFPNPESLCRWIESVHRQYGFNSTLTMLQWFIELLSQKPGAGDESAGRDEQQQQSEAQPEPESKGEGAVTTETPGAYSPVYGRRATVQMPMESLVKPKMQEDEEEIRVKPEPDATEVHVEAQPEPIPEVQPEPVRQIPEAQPDEQRQLSDEEKEKIKRLVAELREILRVIQQYAHATGQSQQSA